MARTLSPFNALRRFNQNSPDSFKFYEGRLLNLARGANTEGLTLPMLEELPVPTVSLSEQEHFSTLVTQHGRLRAVQREALRQAEHLFASLLDRAFNG